MLIEIKHLNATVVHKSEQVAIVFIFYSWSKHSRED